ncbi:glycosyltransferase family protein [Lacibacterium aquatile]|uniref:Glycosyltransferase family protein n=1 Tax=Lacibacterium aquatile TaxID=1168082 RepID=A0ABW5DQ58_9PROT
MTSRSVPAKPRLLFHVQHLLGIGHHRRAERLAAALQASGIAVTVARGGTPVEGENWGGAEVRQLPSARIAGTDFQTLIAEDGQPIDDVWRDRRREALLDLFQEIEPDAVLLEGFPFARRQLRFELLPLLDAVAGSRPRPLVLTSVRDILVEKNKPERTAEVLATIERAIDAVLIHGDPTVIPLERSFPQAEALGDKRIYTGYVMPPLPTQKAAEAFDVVVSVGGGAVGRELLEAALHARPLTRFKDRPWLLIAGVMAAQETIDALTAEAGPGVTIARHREDFRALLAGAKLSVSQAGYNTVLDLLQAGTPSVLIPFAAPGETEQTLRAEFLAAAGRVKIVPEDGLTPEAVAEAIEAAADLRGASVDFQGDGAAETARQVWRLLKERVVV